MIEAPDFVALMIEHEVLRFGEFTLKSGRQSPYFFNLGAIDDGLGLMVLGEAYADALVRHDLVPDVLFGPAYKGIPIATTTAVALKAHHGINVGSAMPWRDGLWLLTM
jgi:orotate phosphoribosyltransferase